ncbi:Leptomycin B resistance protein pmd1 [Venturia nashicola]|nr:Leptomycin B resistance protein pmd1 [Venturia nashicola]
MTELTSMEGIADLLDSGEYSDMSITCKQKVFKVHKAILCTRSSFFRNAMKNGTFTESETGNIDVSEDNPLAVEAVLRFVYQGSYSSLAENNEDAMILHTQVYNLAEMYAIKNLKTVAAAEFEKITNMDFKLPALPLAIKEIYENCPADDKTLRDIAIRIVLSNYDSLLKPNEGDFESTKLIELGDFGRDLLHAKLTRSDLGDSGKVNELVQFHCKLESATWQIDMSKASATFRDSPICPCCAQKLQTMPEPLLPMRRYQCRDCEESLGYNGYYPTIKRFIISCPSCDTNSTRRVFGLVA